MDKKPLSNNTVPTGAIWAFGILFLTALLALPFVVFKVAATTQNQQQGMTLAVAAGIPLDSRILRPSVRESQDRSASAARFELSSVDNAKVAYALAPVDAPSAGLIVSLKRLGEGERGWFPSAANKGPWHEASGAKDGLVWRALLDEGSGTLWIYGVREAGAE